MVARADRTLQKSRCKPAAFFTPAQARPRCWRQLFEQAFGAQGGLHGRALTNAAHEGAQLGQG